MKNSQEKKLIYNDSIFCGYSSHSDYFHNLLLQINLPYWKLSTIFFLSSLSPLCAWIAFCIARFPPWQPTFTTIVQQQQFHEGVFFQWFLCPTTNFCNGYFLAISFHNDNLSVTTFLQKQFICKIRQRFQRDTSLVCHYRNKLNTVSYKTWGTSYGAYFATSFKVRRGSSRTAISLQYLLILRYLFCFDFLAIPYEIIFHSYISRCLHL